MKRKVFLLISVFIILSMLFQSLAFALPVIPTSSLMSSISPLGFTNFIESADTRKIYVSNSTGNDNNTGLSPESPLKTISAGVQKLRSGYPDWLLLKKGDVFAEQSFYGWNKSGRSAAEIMLVSSYGDVKERPVIKLPAGQTAIRTSYRGQIRHLSFAGINFYASHMDPDSPEFKGIEDAAGIFWLSGAENVLIEDCVFNFTSGIAVQDFYGAGINQFNFRRCQILNSYGNGIYMHRVNNSTIEECTFDHNGWNEKVPGANPNIFNHSMYINAECDNITVRNNIIMRSSSHGLQLRCNGTAEGNLVVRNPIGLQLGSTDAPKPGGTTGIMQDNVILEGVDIDPNQPRGWGIELLNIKSGVIKGNIIANYASPHDNGLGIKKNENTQYIDNKFYNWKINEAYDIKWPSQGSFADPGRSVASYTKKMGGDESFEGFLKEITRQSKDNWRPIYTAEAINPYIREGFRPAGSSLSPTPSSTSVTPPTSTVKPSVMPLPTTETGFTKFKESADTRKIYVSSSMGDDSNSGLSPELPLKTLDAGVLKLRDGYPDWLLLKKGDVWTDQSFGEITGYSHTSDKQFREWKKSGRSSAEPMLISSYGDGVERPVVKLPVGVCGIWAADSEGIIKNLAVAGIQFYASHRDPDSPDFKGTDFASGIYFLKGAENILIEDCVFKYTSELTVIDYANNGISQFNFRRCQILNSYYSNGLYMYRVKNSTIEDSILDHNGWNEKLNEANANMFNNGIYVHGSCDNINVKNNIIMRSSSHAIQLHCSGNAEGNLLVRNPAALMFGDNDPLIPVPVTGAVQNNVILEGVDIAPDQPRGWGIDLWNIKSAKVKGNIIANYTGSNNNGFGIRKNTNTQYADNKLYNWQISEDFDIEWPPQGPFSDSGRSVASYNKKLGGEGSFDAFLKELTRQSKDNWRTQYTVGAINSYIYEGFVTITSPSVTVTPVTPSPSTPVITPTPDQGFTKFTESSDTCKIYVSSSLGSDTNSGLSPDAPLRTIEAGISKLRSGYPDWLLLKKGDVFENQSLGTWKKSGRSANEPMLVSSYGDGTKRPVVKAPARVRCLQTSADSGQIKYFSLTGICFYASHRDPDSPDFTGWEDGGGIFWLAGADNILFEDCVFKYIGGIAIQDSGNNGINRINFRRCQVLGSYHSNGIYMDTTKNSTIEECIFDHNGWNEKIPGMTPNIFNHSIYIQSSCDNINIRNNIITRSSSHALQLRCSGTAEGNLIVRNPIAILLGGGDEPVPGGVTGMVQNNVILEGVDITPTQHRGWGIDLQNIKSAVVKGNIVANFATDTKNGLGIKKDANTIYLDNKLYNWVTSEGYDIDWPQQGAFPDPSRSVASYNKMMGGEKSFEAFLNELTKQSKDNWRTQYTAEAINSYIREGFNPVPSLPVKGNIDNPKVGQVLTGTIQITGWALNSKGVGRIEVLVDDKVTGIAVYGDSRPDVQKVYPGYNNANSGYHYILDTTKISEGKHVLRIRETGQDGKTAIIGEKTVIIARQPVRGYIDSPKSGAQVSGIIKVYGWFLDSSGVEKIEVLVDGTLSGKAAYGSPRSDVLKVYPKYNNRNSGFSFNLDTSKLLSGTHILQVRETGKNGGITVLSKTIKV